MKYIRRLYMQLFILMATSAIAHAQNPDSLLHTLDTAQSTSLRAALTTQLAKALYSKYPDSAMAYAKNAQKISKNNSIDSLSARAENILGNIYSEKGENLKALQHFKNALNLYKQLKHPKQIALAYNNCGITYFKLGDFPQSVAFHQKALAIRDSLGNMPKVAKSYNNLAMVYLERNDYDKALQVYRKALAIKKKHADARSLAAGYNNIANAYNRKKNYAKALHNFNKSFAIYDSLASDYGRAAVLNNIGLVYELKKDFNKAVENYKKAYRIYQTTGYKSGLCITQNNVGYMHTQLNNYQKALPYARRSYQLANGLHSKNNLKNSAELLANIHEELGNHKKALHYYKEYKRYSDSLMNESNIEKITELEMQYTFDKKQEKIELERQKERALHQEQLKRQRLIQHVLWAGLLFMLVLAFLIYRNYRMKRRTNKQLLKKNTLISHQKEEIQTQADHLKDANEEITQQKESLEEKTRAITDSIRYARRIQTGLLRGEKLLEQYLSDYFIYWQPSDIVSGDFYWIKKIDDYLLIVAADSTGHGVPGAFMSMLGIAFLNDITRNENPEKPHKALEQLRIQVKDALNQNQEQNEQLEGIDMAFCALNTKTLEMQFAGAFSPLYIIRDNYLYTYRATRAPVGPYPKEYSFKNKRVQMRKGDRFYIFSDGYADQIGGKKGLKFKYISFQKLLKESMELPLAGQKQLLEHKHNEWRGKKYKQIDDILIIGAKV